MDSNSKVGKHHQITTFPCWLPRNLRCCIHQPLDLQSKLGRQKLLLVVEYNGDREELATGPHSCFGEEPINLGFENRSVLYRLGHS
ncbi:hypothetical protein L6164_004314 [Bauhinia variegata]|uniref:Uncharacterized protein n=1 Tax=Bauhinia variegata TaxID=167791 RepID=A0ACB9Q5J5_BAUVA|nr:hypothetical protein L6164_004314 [Bauhinia variegata]